MAQDTIMDIDMSTKIPATVPLDSIPDDIFKAALLASQNDDDLESPYEPQPKVFMQTEDQKRRRERDLEIRKVARSLRNIKASRKQRQQRLKKQKKTPSPFEKLPSELILMLMERTHWKNLEYIVKSSKINRCVFKANRRAILHGMEIEQFPEWRWLFGDSQHKTSAQLQYFKDAVLTEMFVKDRPMDSWKYNKRLLDTLQEIEHNKFTGMRYIEFLQKMQDHLDVHIKSIESETSTYIARRTVVCLKSLTSRRPRVMEEWTGSVVELPLLSWDERSQLVNSQPASIQAEIRYYFKFLILALYRGIEKVLLKWTWQHCIRPGQHMKAKETKKWMSNVVAGHILNETTVKWYTTDINESPTLYHMRLDDLPEWYFEYLADGLAELLERHDAGATNAIKEFEGVLKFGKSIGLDVDGLLDGTLAGKNFDYLSLG